MLTADLVRATVRKGEIRPQYVDADDKELVGLAEQLISIFQDSLGASRRELQSKLDDFLGTGTAFILHRGLAKLIYDRCSFSTASDLDPIEIRAQVFAAAAATYKDAEQSFDREAILDDVNSKLETEIPDLDRQLYGDLKDEQCLTEMRSVDPKKLVDRYNTALAQAVLLRATELVLRVKEQDVKRVRALFRAVRFHRLLHRIESDGKGGHVIRLDGPLSLFHASQRYGMQMANFLPTLLHFSDWTLEAEVLWGKQRAKRKFKLSPKSGLQSHTSLRGQWQPEELDWFAEQFEKVSSDWKLEQGTEVIDLAGNGVFIPDFCFEHEESGKKVYMEIFGFWRRTAVAERAALISEHGPEDVILALSKELHGEKEAIEDMPAHVYVFRSHPIAKDVLKILKATIA